MNTRNRQTLKPKTSFHRSIRRHASLTLGLGAAAWLAGSTSWSADWPQWRGPLRNDLCTETGLLKQWPAGGPPLVWKATDLGSGYSGVAVVGNRIYTMGDGADSGYVRALDAADGQTVWSAKVGKPGGGGGYPGPRCTPTVDGNLTIALGQFGDLVCVETATGKEVWRHNLQSEFGGKMMSGWGYAESPLVDGDKVICTPGGSQGTMACLNKKTGEVLWRSKEWRDNAAYASAIVVEIGGVRQYLQLTDASVAGIAAADGSVLWRAARAGKVAVIPTPIYADNCVYVSSGYSIGCNLFKIIGSGGKFSTEPVYDNKVMVNHHGGVIKVGNCLYGYSDGKGWVCQDFKTGKDLWAEKEKLGKGAIAFADGMLYLRAEGGKGTLVLIEASPEGWSEKGRFDQPNRSDKNSWPHPVISGGRLYIRDQGVLLCYDVKQK
jgi:outer membrane protein assembly factor BamB